MRHSVDEEACERFGLDVAKVRSIARRISKAAMEAEQMGLAVFGGSGTGTLRFMDAPTQGPGHSEVAGLQGYFDGGHGGDVYA